MMPDEQIEVELPDAESADVVLDPGDGEKQIEDPGQKEGMQAKVDPRSTEPAPDTMRWKQVYAKMKDFERGNAERDAKIQEKEAVLEEIRQHNAKLMNKLEELSNRAIDSMDKKDSKPDGPSLEFQALQSTIEQLEAQKADAVENLRGQEVVKIDREIRKLEKMMEQTERAAAVKEGPKPKKEARKESPEIDPEIVEFIDKTKDWFHKNPVMTGAAKEYDVFLSMQPEWKNKPFKERLQKVKEDIEAMFAPKNGGPPAKKPAGVESGAGLSKPVGGPKTVKLTAQQLAVAKGLGLTPEDYAKQVNFIESGR